MMLEWFKRWRWGLAIAALLAAGLGYAFWPEAAKVDVATVSRGAMSVGVTDDGVTRAKDVFVVAAPVTGYMERIELEPGDQVQRGAIVTRMTGRPSTPLDPRSRAELGSALAASRAAEAGIVASLDQARRDLQRAEALAKEGIVSRAALDSARTQVRNGEASLARSRAESGRIAAQLAEPSGRSQGAAVPVRAPASGSVLTVRSESEGVIAEGTPLMEIGDAATIELVVDLISRDAVRVQPGSKVEISQWGGSEPLTGTVKRIEPVGKLKVSALGIEEQRVNVIIGFDAASAARAARLGHGYQVDATIILWSKPDVLRVPIGALFRGADGGWRVFVAKAGRSEERPIKLGHVNDEFGEVVDGLSEGDQVVLNPGSALRDRARVKAR